MLLPPSDSAADVRLVRRAAEGEQAAVEEFLRRLRCVPLILTARNRRLGNPLDTALLQDLAQETLVAIWMRLDQFSGVSSLEAWVYRFCLHKHLAEIRNRGRRTSVVAIESALVQDALESVRGAEIDNEQLHLALAELEGVRAEIVHLKTFEELTFEEIGARLALSPNTAKTHYYRALRTLREALQRRGALPS